jgi:hypothetical protein
MIIRNQEDELPREVPCNVNCLILLTAVRIVRYIMNTPYGENRGAPENAVSILKSSTLGANNLLLGQESNDTT